MTYIYPSPIAPQPCPTCGTCPTCGRQAQPRWPWWNSPQFPLSGQAGDPLPSPPTSGTYYDRGMQ